MIILRISPLHIFMFMLFLRLLIIVIKMKLNGISAQTSWLGMAQFLTPTKQGWWRKTGRTEGKKGLESINRKPFSCLAGGEIGEKIGEKIGKNFGKNIVETVRKDKDIAENKRKKRVDRKNSFDPHQVTFYLAFFLASDLIFYSAILFGIHSGILSGVFFWHSFWHSLAFYLTFCSGILFGIYSDILSGTVGSQPRVPEFSGQCSWARNMSVIYSVFI